MQQLTNAHLEQQNTLDPQAFLQKLENSIVTDHPWVPRALPPREVTKTVEYGIDRAKIGNGFTLDLDIEIFVDLMFQIAPDFDQNKTLRSLLDKQDISPKERWTQLTENPAFEDAWEQVKKNKANADWDPESNGKIQKAYPLTHRMPGFQMLYNKVRAEKWPYLNAGESLSDF